MTIWATVALGDVATIVAGQSPPGDLILESPAKYPFHQGVRDFGRRYPTHRTYCDVPSRLAEEGDVLISVRAPVGRVNIATTPMGIGRGLMAVRGGRELDTDFLSYFLESMVDAWGEHESSGSVFTNLGKSQLAKVPLPLPPLAEQIGIARTLGALDDKIETNRRCASLIDELLHVGFEEIAKTRDVVRVPLAELATVTKGVSYKSADLVPSRTSLVTLKSFDRKGGYKQEGLKQYAGPYKPQQVITPGEVAVAQTDLTQGAEVVGRAIRVPADSSADVLVASLDLAIVRPLRDMTLEYLWGVLADEEFREHCRSRTSGTTVLHLAGDAIPTYLVPMASEHEQVAFTDFARPLIERMESLNRESDKLAALRDTLLPALLSGRIRVVEAAASGVAS